MVAALVKFVLMAATVLLGALGAQNIFKFSSQPDGAAGAAQLPVQFDMRQAFADFNGWLWDAFMGTGERITGYFKNVLPSSSATFGSVVTALMVLALLWILSSKFESIFRTLILVGMMITVVLLILSAVGFV